MKEGLLEKFIGYAKSKFGYDIEIDKTESSDSFETIFGESFLKQEKNYILPDSIEEEFREELEYNCNFDDISLEFVYETMNCEITQEIQLAA